MLGLDTIRSAAERARPYVLRTPLLPLRPGVWMKPELLQPTGSFKVRGFFAAGLALPRKHLSAGLLTVSAGNAAMACAYVARTLGVPCRVVVLDTAPQPKVDGVRRLGARPVPLPRSELLAWMARRGWEAEPEAFVHPFADETLMAGHGGAGIEILEQLPDVRRVVVPVGGGGLVTGVASALKADGAAVEVIGVQSDGYALWPRTFTEGAPPQLSPTTIADGTTAPYEAAMRDRLARCVDRWLTVPEPRLRSAVAELAAEGKLVAEGAGALAYAALEQLEPGPPTVALISGGNIGPSLLAELLARPPT